MKKEFFSTLENILYEQDFQTKVYKFNDFYENFKQNNLIFNHEFKAILKDNSRKDLILVHPTRIRRPKFTNSTQALAKTLHSIAHIEFSAINLALDASYRFTNLPLKFYTDWLEVADEEIKHFMLLQKALEDLGYKYGDFAAHDNLELALKATKDSLNLRMGVVHRGLEAKGLDANPFVQKKLQSNNHPIKSYLKEVLDIILNDEIKHVSKGDFWWNFSKKDDEQFIDLCKKFKQFSLVGKSINEEARLKAGFSQEEIKALQKIDFY
ncbi:ferritin-like domain-containing protein [Campylobacter jejuni]|nr:ferritin-like domain-containing protein [Campylobacter jejuni]